MKDLISKLNEIESICERSKNECDDMEHTAEEIEGYAENIKRDANDARTRLSDAECLLEEVKEAVGKLQGADPAYQALTPDEAEEHGFATYRNGGKNTHYCIDLPQDKRGDEWPVISIKMGDILMTVAPLPTAFGNRAWEPGEGWRGTDVMMHNKKQNVIINSDMNNSGGLITKQSSHVLDAFAFAEGEDHSKLVTTILNSSPIPVKE